MSQTKYLIVGSSHAGLSAIDSIRKYDQDGHITLLTQEKYLPYSPTILPYVVSGLVDIEKVYLRDEESLSLFGVEFKKDSKVVGVNTHKKTVRLEAGDIIGYENLLLATGAEPALPPVSGLEEVSYYVLRTLDDAFRLNEAAQSASSVVVLGAGLIGMHAAENLAEKGRQVTVVEALPSVLPGYFDESTSAIIRQIFSESGVQIHTGNQLTRVAAKNGQCEVYLDSGDALSADLLLLATGVRPRTGFLSESGIDRDEGIFVDEMMRTSDDHIWAAGDVAQGPSFFEDGKRVNAILPNAVEQGRIAGMDMAGDPAIKPFRGGLALNTYRFFGQRAFSVGLGQVLESEKGFEVIQVFQPKNQYCQKIVFKGDRLVGASGINSELDPGILWELIARKTDLGDVKARFITSPLEIGRVMMSRLWR